MAPRGLRGLIERHEQASARLKTIQRHRERLSPEERRVLDGIVHALKPDSMKDLLAPRHLLDFDLARERVLIGVGELDEPTHVSWQISGMRISASNNTWGAAREAAQLHLAQTMVLPHARPLVISWLGHPATSAVDVLGVRAAYTVADHLATDLWDYLGYCPQITPDVHIGLEAHSYGGLFTLKAVHRIALWAQTRSDRIHPWYWWRINSVIFSGPVGIPQSLHVQLKRLRELQVPVIQQAWQIRARGDWLSVIGRVFSGRRRLKVPSLSSGAAREVPELVVATGHNTTSGTGYRDLGTSTLYRLAQASLGIVEKT
ncbi:alpha/beta hydrolase [Auritidibacter ignavus]|uniref:Alpha/beta hydrolase n=1 Tax=Auritidibacter ignavus TaxID=678932 RepID=A0AAJ6DCM6_9MICC|nr:MULTISPECIES: alpha/beta hydrolase [Auritidibacter]PXA79636.1 hypothetical protein DCC26_05195 [Auritidibacter sp. NML120779]PXA78292.1 hypothetical protein DCC24_00995 [Auritidibacter sp. NML100628]PXA81057.1 hypothetical protein DCC25_04245 [Auritidibacter sp. NML120636]WGH81413.1 alpha/beta hydrolase [Auritidibacter ignavus]WGH85295.1 alpha/beta hydrolase [Auritidibacter ignavus]